MRCTLRTSRCSLRTQVHRRIRRRSGLQRQAGPVLYLAQLGYQRERSSPKTKPAELRTRLEASFGARATFCRTLRSVTQFQADAGCSRRMELDLRFAVASRALNAREGTRNAAIAACALTGAGWRSGAWKGCYSML